MSGLPRKENQKAYPLARCDVIHLDAGSIFPALDSFNCEYVGNRIRVGEFEDRLNLCRRLNVG